MFALRNPMKIKAHLVNFVFSYPSNEQFYDKMVYREIKLFYNGSRKMVQVNKQIQNSKLVFVKCMRESKVNESFD
jgi:hypothetical protein